MKKIAFYKYIDQRNYAPGKTDSRLVVDGATYVAGVVVICDDGIPRVRRTRRRNELTTRQMRRAFAKWKRKG